MFLRNKLIFVLPLIFLFNITSMPVAIAQTLPKTQIEIIGTVFEVKDNTIIVFANNTNYIIDASKVNIISSGRNIKISDLKKGDNLIILGQPTKTNIAAAFIFANIDSTAAKGDTFIGTIKELGASTFSLQLRESNFPIQTVNVTTGTVFMRGGISTYAEKDLALGQTVVVIGEKAPDTPDMINASKIEIVVSDTSPKQIIEKEAPAPAEKKPSFFGRIFKAIGNFFTKIFSWL